MTEFLNPGDLPGGLSARHARGDTTWAEWVLGRQVDLIRQIAKEGGAVRDGEMWLATWPACAERLLIRLCSHLDIERGAGPVRFWLGLSSFRNHPDEPNEKFLCRVRTTTRNWETGKAEDGPLTKRCGLNARTIAGYLSRLRDDEEKAHVDSLKILKVTPRWGETQRASDYEWSLDLATIVMRMARPNKGPQTPIDWPFRLSSKLVVAAFLLNRMLRKKGTVSLRRRDLGATGLDVDAAHKTLDWLLEKGFFVKVAEGVAALPEMIKAGVYKKAEGKFWERKPRGAEDHSLARKKWAERPSRTVPKTIQNGLDDHSVCGFEGHSDERSGRPDIEPREVLSEPPEGFELPEERIGGEEANCCPPIIDGARSIELRTPTSGVGKEPTPQSAHYAGQGVSAVREIAPADQISPSTAGHAREARKVFEAVRVFGAGPFHAHELPNHGIAVPLVEKFLEIGASAVEMIEVARRTVDAWRHEGRTGMRWRDLKPAFGEAFGIPTYATERGREVFDAAR